MARKPGDTWTDSDPQFAQRVQAIAQRLANDLEPRADSDPLDVAAAKLWLEWTLPE